MSDQITIVFPFSDIFRSPEDAERERKVALLMIASCRKAMPSAQIVQLTDEGHTSTLRVDRVHRRPFYKQDWVPWMYEGLAEFPGKVLFMDSDVIVQRDLCPMFLTGADVVLTSRGPKTMAGRQMPFLIGVVATKMPEFWLEAARRVAAMEDHDDRNWWGSQVVLFDMWMDQQDGKLPWKIASVSCDPHNYVPTSPHDAPADKWVLHYKGKKRKPWMLEKWSYLLQEKAAA